MDRRATCRASVEGRIARRLREALLLADLKCRHMRARLWWQRHE